MNNNILLSDPNEVFQPHILNNKALPLKIFKAAIKRCDYPNFHENLELLYFKSGKGSIKYGKTTYDIKAEDIVIVNSYTTHQILVDEKIERLCLIIDNGFCKQNNIDASHLCFNPRINDEYLSQQLDILLEVYEGNSEFKNLEVRCILLNILLFLCKNYNMTDTQEKTSYKTHEFLRRTIEYVKNNYNQKITVDNVAANVGLSKYHFLREFKKHTGYTLTTYINIIRCEQAQEMLQSGKYQVKEVALLCGFDNYSYFTNVFKKNMGALPSSFNTAKK